MGALIASVSGQTLNFASASSSAVAAANDPLLMLPASDAVAVMDIKRVFTEAMPRALPGNRGKLPEVNAEFDRFKTRRGIDLRSFDRLAAGMRFDDTATASNEERKVALAQGSFNAGAIVAAGRL